MRHFFLALVFVTSMGTQPVLATGPDVAAMHQLAEQGDAESQHRLGKKYFLGQGVEKNYGKAMQWYRKAAEQGHAGAQYSLGRMYDGGVGVVQNYAEAAKWYRTAAEQGDPHAQASLGVSYYEGQGVAQDNERAYFWLLLATVEGGDEIRKVKDMVGEKLTGPQINKIQAEASAWQPDPAD